MKKSKDPIIRLSEKERKLNKKWILKAFKEWWDLNFYPDNMKEALRCAYIMGSLEQENWENRE